MPQRKPPRVLARSASCLYLGIEVVGTIGFWTLLTVSPHLAERFAAEGVSEVAFRSLLAPDLLVYLITGIAALAGLILNRDWAGAFLWLHAGAAMFAAVLALSWAIILPGGWLGFAVMAPLLVGPIAAACCCASMKAPQ